MGVRQISLILRAVVGIILSSSQRKGRKSELISLVNTLKHILTISKSLNRLFEFIIVLVQAKFLSPLEERLFAAGEVSGQVNVNNLPRSTADLLRLLLNTECEKITK